LQEDLIHAELYPETSMSKQNIDWLSILSNCCYFKANEPIYINNQYNHMLATDCLNLLPEKFLMKADKATMANTIEERLPLLDKEIIDFAFTLPIHLKKDKYILRQAVKDLLPYEIINRPKVGFGTPVAYWLNSKPLFDFAYDRIKNGRLLNGICNKKSLNQLCNYYFKNKLSEKMPLALNISGILWNLFTLQLWHDIYFKESR
jgi:asparagine synthase (glutamine-hydrolysing)